MSLSQREQMILREIEDELTRQDPSLSARLTGSDAGRPRSRAVPVALLTSALGIALVICGAIAAAPPVAWIGVAVALAASFSLLVAVARLLHPRQTGL